MQRQDKFNLAQVKGEYNGGCRHGRFYLARLQIPASSAISSFIVNIRRHSTTSTDTGQWLVVRWWTFRKFSFFFHFSSWAANDYLTKCWECISIWRTMGCQGRKFHLTEVLLFYFKDTTTKVTGTRFSILTNKPGRTFSSSALSIQQPC